jgi:hypothetical protein
LNPTWEISEASSALVKEFFESSDLSKVGWPDASVDHAHSTGWTPIRTVLRTKVDCERGHVPSVNLLNYRVLEITPRCAASNKTTSPEDPPNWQKVRYFMPSYVNNQCDARKAKI